MPPGRAHRRAAPRAGRGTVGAARPFASRAIGDAEPTIRPRHGPGAGRVVTGPGASPSAGQSMIDAMRAPQPKRSGRGWRGSAPGTHRLIALGVAGSVGVGLRGRRPPAPDSTGAEHRAPPGRARRRGRRRSRPRPFPGPGPAPRTESLISARVAFGKTVPPGDTDALHREDRTGFSERPRTFPPLLVTGVPGVAGRPVESSGPDGRAGRVPPALRGALGR